MGISNHDDNERNGVGVTTAATTTTTNRRQLLTRVGSFMKYSWRRSTEMFVDESSSAEDKMKQKQQQQRKNATRGRCNLFVQFDDFIKIHHYSCHEEDGKVREENTPEEEEAVVVEDDSSSSTSLWYNDDDYIAFKKDQRMSSMNYRNALNANNNSVAAAFFDETKYCIRGIEYQVNHAGTSVKYQRFDTRKHKKTVRKVLIEELKRQKRERAAASSYSPTDVAIIEYYYDWNKFREAVLPYTKNERDRAIARGRKYAKEQEKENENEDGESSKGCGGRRRRRRGRRRTRFSSLSSSRSPSSSNDRSHTQHNTSDHDEIERRSQ